jgi:hypothetical protein
MKLSAKFGGTSDWDMNLAALQAIRAEWDRTDLSFVDRHSDFLGNGNWSGLKPLNAVWGKLHLPTPAINPKGIKGRMHGDRTKDTLLGSLNAPSRFFGDASGTDTDNYCAKRGDKRSFVRSRILEPSSDLECQRPRTFYLPPERIR